MKKFIIIISIPLLLMGCAAIPAPLIALGHVHTGADVVSVIATGKTTTDHAISKILNKDCVLFRLVKGKKICSKIIEKNIDCDIFHFDDLKNPKCKPKDITDEF